MRLTSLDGLRGVAALTVLAHHSLLLFPVLADPHYSGRAVSAGNAAWWLTHTPLHILWEGKAGVYVFFVLSGFVLTLPAINGRRYNWSTYYPSRLLRLYLPVWGAVLFAVATYLVVPRTGDVSSAWLADRPEEVTAGRLIRDFTLVTGNGGLASPLWSLTWEILFSLALPLGIWAAIKLRRTHALLVVAAVAVVTVGSLIDETLLMFPPMFMLGVILAMRRDHVSEWAAGIKTPGWVLILIGASLAVSSGWMIMAFGAPDALIRASVGLMLVGAFAFVVIALEWAAAARILDTKPLRVVGVLSFSLYLVHEPIIVAAGFALPNNPGVAMLVAIPIVAVVTPLFYVAVERPSHRLAKRVGKLVGRRSVAAASD